MTLLLKGGLLVDPSQGLEELRDVLIEDGRVKQLGQIQPESGWEVRDVSGCVVAPGFIDMHVHLRQPGQEDKETIATGCEAALRGGFTSIACMPNTDPVNDNAAITGYIVAEAAKLNSVNVFPVGAITRKSRGKRLADIGKMVQAGAVAISDDGRPVQNNQVMRRAFEYSTLFGIPVLDHCEDVDLAARGCMNEGKVSTEMGLRGLSRAAEEMHVVRDLILSRLTGARAHVCHLSTRESLKWVKIAKEEGVALTCEVTPHHFTLTDDEVRGYRTESKMNPPLRTAEDVEAILEGLASGTVDCIATDHAPHTRVDKETDFEKAANGIVGLETAVGLVWDRLVRRQVITVSRAVELLSTAPGRILNLDRGSLAEDRVADVTVVDPKKKWSVDPSGFKSKGRNTPFEGYELTGRPRMTVVGGRILWEDER